jgi:hypothetical protein
MTATVPFGMPAGFWSLWDMLRFNAQTFYKVTSAIRRVGELIETYHKDEEHPDGSITINLTEDKVFIETVTEVATELRASLDTLDAKLTIMTTDRLLGLLKDERSIAYVSIKEACEEIDSRLRDELSLVKVFVLEANKHQYYQPSEPLFGKDFETKFPNAAFELDEAAKCLALSRPTAAVFHLMRLMEIGLKAVARCLGIPDPTKAAERNWGAILSAIKTDLEVHGGKTPTKTWKDSAGREFFESAYASLDAVRVAWRNTTMHVENKYTDEEAEHLFGAVRGFMKKLASRLDENGDPRA